MSSKTREAADTARLDWLEANGADRFYGPTGLSKYRWVNVHAPDGQLYSPTLREAIDKAMQAEKE